MMDICLYHTCSFYCSGPKHAIICLGHVTSTQNEVKREFEAFCAKIGYELLSFAPCEQMLVLNLLESHDESVVNAYIALVRIMDYDQVINSSVEE